MDCWSKRISLRWRSSLSTCCVLLFICCAETIGWYYFGSGYDSTWGSRVSGISNSRLLWCIGVVGTWICQVHVQSMATGLRMLQKLSDRKAFKHHINFVIRKLLLLLLRTKFKVSRFTAVWHFRRLHWSSGNQHSLLLWSTLTKSYQWLTLFHSFSPCSLYSYNT